MRDGSYTNFYPIFRNRGLQSTCFIIFQYTYTKLGKNHGTTRGLVRSLDWVSIPSFSHNGGKRWHMLELLRLKAPPRQESTHGTNMGKTTLIACSKPNHRSNPCFFLVFNAVFAPTQQLWTSSRSCSTIKGSDGSASRPRKGTGGAEKLTNHQDLCNSFQKRISAQSE